MRPVNHEGTPEERLMRLECAYDELLQHAVTHQQLDKSDTYLVGAIEEVNRRLDKLQDANLTPVLEGMNVVVNPGTGEIQNASEAHARLNMAHFVADLNMADSLEWVRLQDRDERGRFAFLVFPSRGSCQKFHIVDMPGCPLSQVRMEEGDNPWNFYRLYVDGSSWLWGVALGMCNFCEDDLEREE